MADVDNDLSPVGRLKKLDANTAMDGPPWAGSFAQLDPDGTVTASLDPELLDESDDTVSLG